MPKEKLKHLTARTETATDEFIQRNIINGDRNYTYRQALLDAGFSPVYVSRSWFKLSQNPLVQHKITNLTQKASIKAELTVGKVLVGINEALEIARSKQDVTGMLKALELQGKHLAMFTDVQLTDNFRQDEIDKKVLNDARLFAQLAMPKLLTTDNTIHTEFVISTDKNAISAEEK
jgi:hypothetical protein